MKNTYKEVTTMILFALLAIITIILAVIVFAAVIVGGVGFIFVFGDVIVCVVFLVLVLKHMVKK